ncbi:MAG: FAD-dependent oxidoreductase [Atopobiaceae bacterium]|nr:FAD-dependent oxidoreductase [Atopobiaceae bacterium]
MDRTTEQHDLVIVGAGPAGLAASIYATRAMLDSVTIEGAAMGGQISLTDEIENYPAVKSASGVELAQLMQEHAEGMGAHFAYDNIEAIKLLDDGTFSLQGGKTDYIARSVIYAGGAKPRLAGFEGEKEYTGRGVSYCATCDGMFYRNKEVFVVGGGNTACEEALFLAKFASKVTLVVRKDHVRAVPAIARQIEENERIEIRYLTSVVELKGNMAPTDIVFRNNETEETYSEHYDEGMFGVFVFVGYDPATKLVEDFVELSEDGAVITDDTMATKTAGLFCAGDIRRKPLRQVITAASDGAVAASSASHYLGAAVVA